MSDFNQNEMPYDDCIDAETPPDIPLCAKYKKSFAYTTVKDRLPIILTQIVDQLSRFKDSIIIEYGEDAREEIKNIIGAFSKLKNEVQTNKPLIPLTSTASDVMTWNTFLSHQTEVENSVPRWYDSPWLYVECYMYRRIQEAFELSKSLNNFDPFRKLKEASLPNSMGAIKVLAAYMHNLLQKTPGTDIKNEFFKLLYVNLWGNRCDLSLSAGGEIILEEDPLQKVVQFKENILTDRAENIWDTLANVEKTSDILDIVMDNAGYELYTDLCLADFIITFCLAKQVRFRVKVLPWYVSDTRTVDFHWSVNELKKINDSNVSLLAEKWCSYLDRGIWTLHADDFWTLPHDYSQMNTIDPKLYSELSDSALVIFKGDLNYRKLTGDINWEPTKPFSEALRGFAPTKIATLRTLKADVICGLLPGQAEAAAEKNSDWLISGQYAVIQFNG